MGQLQHAHAHSHIMALSIFNQAWPVARRPASFWGPSPSFFREGGSLFAESDARRQAFMDEMDVDTDNGTGRSYSYSSTTVRHGDQESVTSSREILTQGGDRIARTRKSIGDRMVETQQRGDATTQTIAGMTADEAVAFEAEVEESLGTRSRGFPQQPEITQEAQAPIEAPIPAWETDGRLADLQEYGFGGEASRAALNASEGDVKVAIKELVAQERKALY